MLRAPAAGLRCYERWSASVIGITVIVVLWWLLIATVALLTLPPSTASAPVVGPPELMDVSFNARSDELQQFRSTSSFPLALSWCYPQPVRAAAGGYAPAPS